MSLNPSRRDALVGGVSLAAMMLLGCSRAPADGPAAAERQVGADPVGPAAPRFAATMIVYREPGCGCCLSWADIAREAGYDVAVREETDMASIKRRLGVPDALASCHTAIVDGLVVEGHVPMVYVARLLAERPAEVRGIAVPGMPVGSPGMEVPGGRVERFEVFAFDGRGRTRAFRV